jgi:hypothetical protein
MSVERMIASTSSGFFNVSPYATVSMARTGWDDDSKLWETMGFLQRHAQKHGFFGV